MDGMGVRTHPEAALDEEDQAAREGGALAEYGQDVLAGHIARIHHQLHNIKHSLQSACNANHYLKMHMLR